MTTNQASVNSPLRQLTAQEFIDIVTEVDKGRYAEFYHENDFDLVSIIIDGIEISENIILTDGIVVKSPLIINGGNFGKDFAIEGATFSKGIKLNGGKFSKNFVIHNGIFKDDFTVGSGVFDNDFLVYGGTFNDGFYIHGGTFGRDFGISGGSFDGNFAIENGNFMRDFILKGSCAFNSNFNIYGGKFYNEFRIVNGAYNGDFGIYGGSFLGHFRILHGYFNNNFSVKNGVFDGNFAIGSGIFRRGFTFSGGTLNGHFFVSGGTFITGIVIGNTTFNKEVVLMDGYICTLSIDYLISTFRLQVSPSCQINSLLINSTVSKDSLIQFLGSLYYLSFEDSQNFGNLTFINLSYRELPYIPNGVLLPEDYDRPESPEVQILNSDLGKTIFIDCDLSGFGLNFKSSKLTDVFVTGTKMPREIVTLDPAQKQLGYSQIKKIYEARGDRVEANRYYAREMEAYRQTLSLRKWKDMGEKLNLNLNRFSTNYGQSWGLGLLTTLLVSAFFYWLYCLALGFYPGGSIDLFSKLASYFLEFLNPIHKADYVAEQLLKKETPAGAVKDISNSARTIEGISRIFIAYFVYQLIQAFRKHGKASG